jgi:hypothetical protein
VATSLHNDYGFSYDNLKVLLGGWNTWKDFNNQDPNGYPIETGPGTTQIPGGKPHVDVTPAAPSSTPKDEHLTRTC